MTEDALRDQLIEERDDAINAAREYMGTNDTAMLTFVLSELYDLGYDHGSTIEATFPS